MTDTIRIKITEQDIIVLWDLKQEDSQKMSEILMKLHKK